MRFVDVHYRPLGGRILTGVTVVVAVAGVVAMAVRSPLEAVRYGWPLLLVAALAVVLFWMPSLHVQEHGITVVNPLRTYFISWPAIERIETRWSLSLTTAQRTVTVWAAPAPSRHRASGLSRSDFIGVGDSAQGQHGSLRPSDALSTVSGNLAQVIRGHWERLRDTGALDAGADPTADTARTNTAAVVVVASLAAATLLGLLL